MLLPVVGRHLRRLGFPAAAVLGSAAALAGCGFSHQGVDQPGHYVGRNQVASDGGSVQHHPRIYAVFWGPGWRSDDTGTKAAVVKMFRSLSHTRWNHILTQYYDSAGHVTGDVRLAGTWSDTSSSDLATDSHGGGTSTWETEVISDEVDKAVSTNGWNVTTDSQVMVFLPPGQKVGSKACGWHTSRYPEAISVIAGPNADNCDSGSSGVTGIASHEYAETVVDPYPMDGWDRRKTDGAPDPLGEIADLCRSESSVDIGGGVTVSQIYDLRTGRCDGNGVV